MNSYSDFKKELGLKGPEIEKLTGYSRQGLNRAFASIDAGEEPSKKLCVCINTAIEKLIQNEMQQHEEKIAKLKGLQTMFQEPKVISILKDHICCMTCGHCNLDDMDDQHNCKCNFNGSYVNDNDYCGFYLIRD